MADATATPYAEALFTAARDAGKLKEVNRDLSGFVRSLSESRELARALFNPAVPAEAKHRVLGAMTRTGEPLVASTLAVMLDRGRLELLPDVHEAFADRYRREVREMAVTLTTAIPIDDAQAEQVRGKLEAATGHTIDMQRNVDPAILGGVILRVRDTLIDASIRRRFETMRRNLRAARLPS